MDPSTFAGSAFVSGVFTLTPHQPGPTVTIADTNPAVYSHGIGLRSTSANGTLGNITRVINQNGGAQQGRDDLYGWFTFTNQYGTFTGYATPDFRSFQIEIQFDRYIRSNLQW